MCLDNDVSLRSFTTTATFECPAMNESALRSLTGCKTSTDNFFLSDADRLNNETCMERDCPLSGDNNPSIRMLISEFQEASRPGMKGSACFNAAVELDDLQSPKELLCHFPKMNINFGLEDTWETISFGLVSPTQTRKYCEPMARQKSNFPLPPPQKFPKCRIRHLVKK